MVKIIEIGEIPNNHPEMMSLMVGRPIDTKTNEFSKIPRNVT